MVSLNIASINTHAKNKYVLPWQPLTLSAAVNIALICHHSSTVTNIKQQLLDDNLQLHYFANSNSLLRQTELLPSIDIILVTVQEPTSHDLAFIKTLRTINETFNKPIFALLQRVNMTQVQNCIEFGANDVFLIDELNMRLAVSLHYAKMYHDIEQQYQELLYQRDDHKNLLISAEQLNELTGLPNYEYLQTVIAKLKQQNKVTTEVHYLLDIQLQFRDKINNKFADKRHDAVIKKLSDIFNKNILRNSDIVAHVADNSFQLLLPNTSEVGAKIVADRLEQALAQEFAQLLKFEIRFKKIL